MSTPLDSWLISSFFFNSVRFVHVLIMFITSANSSQILIHPTLCLKKKKKNQDLFMWPKYPWVCVFHQIVVDLQGATVLKEKCLSFSKHLTISNRYGWYFMPNSHLHAEIWSGLFLRGLHAYCCNPCEFIYVQLPLWVQNTWFSCNYPMAFTIFQSLLPKWSVSLGREPWEGAFIYIYMNIQTYKYIHIFIFSIVLRILWSHSLHPDQLC